MSDVARLSEAELRERLEILRREPPAEGASADELRRVVHELQVHQVELEMQNRSLRETHDLLEESRGRYADLFDFAPVAYCTFDVRARILEINLAGAALLARERGALIGRPLGAVAEIADPAGFLAALGRCVREQARVSAEVTLTPLGGEPLVLEMVVTPAAGGGVEAGGTRAAFLDVTEQRRAERERDALLAQAHAARREAEVASRAKDVFLATVSHELRTPLAALLLWEDVLRAEPDDAAARGRALDAIRQCARTQSRLIDDLLDVARSASGKLAIDRDDVAIGPVVEAAVEAARPSAGAKGVALELDVDPAAGCVLGDATRLEQVVSNLVANAVKFTARGGRAAVRASRVGATVEIAVSDTGRGIEPAFLPHVFAPFSQADGSTARDHGGLGLGLAIVRGLVELHGGSVRAESAGAGRGATFTVTLPARATRKASRRPAAPPPPPRMSAGEDELRGLRVLVVDDDAAMRDGVAVVLRQAGAHVESAASPADAIAALDRVGAPWDVIATDLAMPGEDGYAFLRRVRARPAARGGGVPVVAVTASAGPGDRARAEAAGFAVFVPKPVDAWSLIAAIASAAGRTRGG